MERWQTSLAGADREVMIKVVGAALLAILIVAGGALIVLQLTAPRPRDAQEWYLGAPLPSARGELATATAHRTPCPEPPCPEAELLYVVGGLTGMGRTEDAVSVFDPVVGQWSTAPTLPAGRHHLGAAGLGSALYVSGGTEGAFRPWTPYANLWRLEPGGGWEVLAPMPEPRWGHRMIGHDGRLFVVGGHGPTSRVLIYEPDTGWRLGAPMPQPRHHLSVVAAGGRIWAIGGRAPESLDRVDIYDPVLDRWDAGPALPAPTSGAAEGVVDGKILIYGGEEPALFGGQVIDRHWLLDPAESLPRWRPAPPPPLPVHGADGAVFQETLVVAGGASRHGALSVTAWTDAVQWLRSELLPTHDGYLAQ
jgi:hypothetical protein